MQDEYKHKGYMTEALRGLIKWMLLNIDVKYIIADTLKDNILSHKLLQKIGMSIYKEDEECFWWRLKEM